MVTVEEEAGGLRKVDGLARRPREVLGDAGDTGLLPEVFRGGVDGRTGGCEDFEDLGDGPPGGSFSLTSGGFCGGSESRTSLLSRVAKGSIPSEPGIACSLTISTASSGSVFCELLGSLRDVTGLEEKPPLELKSGTG